MGMQAGKKIDNSDKVIGKDERSMLRKIVISAGWGYGNIGDEAILKYTYINLCNEFPSIPIQVLSFDTEITSFHHSFDANPNLHKIIKSNAGKNYKTYCMNILNGQIEMPDYIVEYEEQFDDETMFVMAGGGYFNDHWSESFYAHLCEIYIAARRHAKIAMIGQTIGPFSNNRNRELFKSMLRYVDYIDVRDQTSYDVLKSLLGNREIHLSCDAVIRNGAYNQKETREKRIAIMYQRKRPYTKPDTSRLSYRISQIFHLVTGQSLIFTHRLCGLIRELHALYPDYEIVFLQSTNWRESEIEKIVKRSKADGVKFNNNIDEYIMEIAQSDLVITTNMHPAIIATTMGIPAIAISHTYKIDDYMKLIGQKNCIFYNIEIKKICSMTDDLLNNIQIRKELLNANEYLRKRLNEVYSSLKALCNDNTNFH